MNANGLSSAIMARPFQHPSASTITVDGILHALSDPTRRGIMIKLLSCAGMSCSKACDDLSPSTISFHHRVLREAGLIRSEKRGVEVINTVRKADINARFPGLLATILKYHTVS
jgi:DNA-binding transcriptional ArsR family regulator